MSTEEDLRKLREFQKQREKSYIELKGMLEGIRLQKLNRTDEALLKLAEFMIDGFKNLGDDVYGALEQQIRINQRVSSLDARMKELENNILQLRETLDKLFQAR